MLLIFLMGTSRKDPLPVVLERDYARVETLFALLVTAVDDFKYKV